MTRRAFLLTLFGVPMTGTTVFPNGPTPVFPNRPTDTSDVQPPRVISLAVGKFDATVQEAQEGYFSIGTGAALVLNPAGVPIDRAREQVGTTGTLMWVRD